MDETEGWRPGPGARSLALITSFHFPWLNRCNITRWGGQQPCPGWISTYIRHICVHHTLQATVYSTGVTLQDGVTSSRVRAGYLLIYDISVLYTPHSAGHRIVNRCNITRWGGQQPCPSPPQLQSLSRPSRHGDHWTTDLVQFLLYCTFTIWLAASCNHLGGLG